MAYPEDKHVLLWDTNKILVVNDTGSLENIPDHYRFIKWNKVHTMELDLRSSAILRRVEWQFCTDVSEQPIFKGLQGSKSLLGLLDPWGWHRWGCPETSVQNYHSTMRNIAEERKSQSLCVSTPPWRCTWTTDVKVKLCTALPLSLD
jgi:hypothetical protein